MKLSVIVPIFNVAPYLRECLDSLVRQTLDDMEIILVNDGSTDESPEIIAEYQKRYPNWIVVHQSNQGSSMARNAGMREAHGEYLAFLDSDDFVDPMMYETLCAMVVQDDLDIAISNGCSVRANGEEKLLYPTLKSTDVITGQEWLCEAILTREFFHGQSLCIYRRVFIKDLGIQFIPELYGCEDLLWASPVLCKAERVRYIDTPLYYYRYRPDSLAHNATLPHLLKAVRSYMLVLLKLDQFIQENATHLRIEPELRWQIANEASNIFYIIKKLPTFSLKRVQRQLIREMGLIPVMWRNVSDRHQKRRALRRIMMLYLYLPIDKLVAFQARKGTFE